MSKNKIIVVTAIMVMCTVVLAACMVGSLHKKTSKIIGKDIDYHFNGNHYIIALEDGTTHTVSYADYCKYDIGDEYTYVG